MDEMFQELEAAQEQIRTTSEEHIDEETLYCRDVAGYPFIVVNSSLPHDRQFSAQYDDSSSGKKSNYRRRGGRFVKRDTRQLADTINVKHPVFGVDQQYDYVKIRGVPSNESILIKGLKVKSPLYLYTMSLVRCEGNDAVFSGLDQYDCEDVTLQKQMMSAHRMQFFIRYVLDIDRNLLESFADALRRSEE